MKQINIGKIIGTFGVKGELKVYSDSDFIAKRLKVGTIITLKQNTKETKVTLSSIRFHKNMPLITIDDKNDINEVIGFVSSEIIVDDVLQDNDLEEDEFLLDDLIGLKVNNTKNEYLGIVTDVIILPSSSVLEIKNNEQKILIPFVDEYIVNVTDDSIIVDEIEGFR